MLVHEVACVEVLYGHTQLGVQRGWMALLGSVCAMALSRLDRGPAVHTCLKFALAVTQGSSTCLRSSPCAESQHSNLCAAVLSDLLHYFFLDFLIKLIISRTAEEPVLLRAWWLGHPSRWQLP